MQELGTQRRAGLKGSEDSGSQTSGEPYSLFHDRERKVYELTPAGGITIVVIVYDEDESSGL